MNQNQEPANRSNQRVNINLRTMLIGCAMLAVNAFAAETRTADLCIYGATPSGITAAVAGKRGGLAVLIVEPSRWVGGILGAGLKPLQDCPNFQATGGLTSKWLLTLGSPNWDGTGSKRDAVAVCTRAVREDFEKIIRENEITVIFNHRVAACDMRGKVIAAAVFDRAPFDELGCPVAKPELQAALRVEAKMFIDASYEGELMFAAGVTTRVGREAAEDYDETPYAGVRPPSQSVPIDPFIVPGDRSSGLLKWVENDHGLPTGSADHYTQAYNYRYYTTRAPEHRAPITPPPDYNAQDYELVGRYVEYLKAEHADQKQLFEKLKHIFPGWMNAREWNYHRGSLITMAPVGVSHFYASGDYAEKARIWKLHQDYLRGLHTFMSTDPRVPQAFRQSTAELGLDLRIHPETQGWPHQLYIRVARRLNGEYTITSHDVYNKRVVEDPIGLAQYGIDTYPARRYWHEENGQVYVALEGNMWIGGARGPSNMPYPIPYRAITPKKNECANLLVPVLFSASHIGYASSRMEPTFMILGESAAIAAAQAIKEKVPVQEVNAVKLRQSLENAGQKLTWEAATQ